MTFEVYRNKAKEYKWRILDRYKVVIATGVKAYQKKRDCMNAVMAITNRLEPFGVNDTTQKGGKSEQESKVPERETDKDSKKSSKKIYAPGGHPRRYESARSKTWRGKKTRR